MEKKRLKQAEILIADHSEVARISLGYVMPDPDFVKILEVSDDYPEVLSIEEQEIETNEEEGVFFATTIVKLNTKDWAKVQKKKLALPMGWEQNELLLAHEDKTFETTKTEVLKEEVAVPKKRGRKPKAQEPTFPAVAKIVSGKNGIDTSSIQSDFDNRVTELPRTIDPMNVPTKLMAKVLVGGPPEFVMLDDVEEFFDDSNHNETVRIEFTGLTRKQVPVKVVYNSVGQLTETRYGGRKQEYSRPDSERNVVMTSPTGNIRSRKFKTEAPIPEPTKDTLDLEKLSEEADVID